MWQSLEKTIQGLNRHAKSARTLLLFLCCASQKVKHAHIHCCSRAVHDKKWDLHFMRQC